MTALLPLLALPCLPSPALPQEVTALTEGLCATCSLDVTRDVLLGADGESVIGMAWDIHRLSDGRITMTFAQAWSEFTIFPADGSGFQRVGRQGEGPGEYSLVWRVRQHGEELYVFDGQQRRMTVLNPDFEVVRTSPVRCVDCNGADMAVLRGGGVALNYFMVGGPGEEALAADAGFAVHILSPDGETLHSLDEIPTESPPRPTEHPARWLEVAPDGSLLSLHLTSYRIDRWDPETGERLQTFSRGADWFPDGQSYGHSAEPGRPPATTTSGLHLDESGRLWVHISRPAPDWEERLERTRSDAHPEAGPWRYGPGSSESVIEVLDLESGRVLVSQVVDLAGGLGQFFAPGWMAVYDEEPIPRYRMWRVILVGME